MIIRVDPPDWKHSSTVQLDSDALDNMTAVRVIEDWAAERGFARTDEFWLRRALQPDGRRIFRGICFRLMPDELAASEQESREVEQRVKKMPVSVQAEAG